MNNFLLGVAAGVIILFIFIKFAGMQLRSKILIKPSTTIQIIDGISDTTYYYREQK